MAVYAVDSTEFRQNEGIVIGMYTGRFGFNLQWAHVLHGRCIQHGGVADIWADAYHALYRYESAQLVLTHDDEVAKPEQLSPAKRKRVTNVTCFVERECGRIHDAAARFTVSVDSVGRVRGEAVATGAPLMKIARVRVDPSNSAVEIGLAVLLHLASREHHPVVADLIQRMRRGGM
ncbi:hypothetical protein B0G80_3573 [Paraburkholderia sp. BL6669N2]|uniref:hypothetical protein n=1 Tax=Paraburkholderia sp. BL6669N2 TaxID=1938807 RepID=UPI000E280D58|nr:hypothetical protein [Paraburkholderia sp. BL6669N2]REG60762.1 hypothetical protein B0G80_3573 [Paraburkholderia sp. BL6669N2]